MYDLRTLALATVRARAMYEDTLMQLMQAATPLGIRVEHKAQLEEVIKQIALDENTNLPELDALVNLAQGRQH